MPYRKYDTSDVFPRTCEVRRCSARPRDWFPDGGMLFDVCREHEFELRAGEPHAIDAGKLLVGPDSTGQLLGVHAVRTPTSTTAVLALGRDGVVHLEVEIDLTEGGTEPAVRLRTALDALGIERDEARIRRLCDGG